MTIFLGLILALLPSYLFRFEIFGLPGTFLEILIAAFLLIWIIRQWRDWDTTKTKIKRLGNLNWAIIFFMLAGGIAVLISPDTLRALGQFKAFILEPVLLFYATLSVIKNEDDKNFVLGWLFVGAVLVALFGIVQYFTNLGLPLRFWGSGMEPKRITSFFEYPNALALYLAPLFGFFLILQLKKRFKYPLIASLGLLIMAVSLLLTFSRGAWFAIFITIAAMLLLLNKNKWKAGIVIVAATALILLPPVQSRLTLADAASVARQNLFEVGLAKIQMSPILGNGLHGFSAYDVEYPHNFVLNFWLELGLLGLLSFIAVIFLTAKNYKLKPTDLRLAVLAYLSIMLLHGLVDVPYFKNDLSVLFWFMLSLFYIEG